MRHGKCYVIDVMSENVEKKDGFSVSLVGEQSWPPRFHVVKVTGLPQPNIVEIPESVEAKVKKNEE